MHVKQTTNRKFNIHEKSQIAQKLLSIPATRKFEVPIDSDSNRNETNELNMNGKYSVLQLLAG